MIGTARIVGFALIASVAFGTAAAISAVGNQATEATRSAIARSAPEPGPYGFGARLEEAAEACTVEFMAGEAGGHRVALQLDSTQSIDLDGPASAGFTVSCGAGASGTAVADAGVSNDDGVWRGDRL